MNPNRNIYLGLFLLCASLLIAELLLTRIFSVCLWYHFAFFVISIAMFGLGLGGICVQLFPQRFDGEDLPSELFDLTIRVAITAFIGPVLLMKTYIPPEIFSSFGAPTVLFLSVAFLICSLPFFFGGVITSLIFKNFSAHISKLYFSDLVGASLGCIATIAILDIFGGPTALFVNSALLCVAAICFLYAQPRKPSTLQTVVISALLLIFVGGGVLNYSNRTIDVAYAKGRDRRLDEFSKWNSISRIAVIPIWEKEVTRLVFQNVWGGSTKYQGEYPPVKMIDIDADAGTWLLNFTGDFEGPIKFIQYDPPSLVHRLKSRPSVLVVGAGGGKDVLTALSFGAEHVTAVELNPITVNDVMLDKYRKFSGDLYRHPKVTAVAEEGRNFVASSKSNYDIIQLAFVDTAAATSGGAYVLAENTLYTKESFQDFLSHLNPEGVLSVCFGDTAALAGATRLVSIATAALEGLGVADTGKNIMVISVSTRQWVVRNVLLKRTPFTPEEQRIIVKTAAELGFDPTYIPMKDEGPVSPSKLDEPGSLIKAIINNKSDRKAILDSYPLNVSATSDDRPFFFYQNHPRNFFKIMEEEKIPGLILYTSGSIVLVRVLIVGLIMVGLFYLIPMIISAWNKEILHDYPISAILPFLIYFSSIGFGFIILEIGFLQKLMLFLGHPLYTLSTTLLSILLFAGVGSLYTERVNISDVKSFIMKVILILLVVSSLYVIILPPIFHFFMGYSKWIKIPIAILVLMPLSFFMGMPLPLAVKVLHQRMNAVIPWMWGINGATSVLGSICAIILAMNLGYNFTLVVGMVFYLLALLMGKFCFPE